jgi:hypothetical protein
MSGYPLPMMYYPDAVGPDWDISSANFDGLTSSAIMPTLEGVFFDEVAEIVYSSGASGADGLLRTGVLSDPEDISTYSQTGTTTVVGTSIQGMTRWGGFTYYCDNTNNTIVKSDGTTLSVGAQDGTPQGVAISPDGTMLFMVGSSTDAIYLYNLVTPGVFAGGSYSGLSFSVAGQTTALQSIFLNPNGRQIFVGEFERIYQYHMPVWDFANLAYSGIQSPDLGTSCTGFYIFDNGLRMYSAEDGFGADGVINQYTLTLL